MEEKKDLKIEEKIQSVELPTNYANTTAMEVGIYDFKMLFGIKTGTREKINSLKDMHSAIIMSPQHAKAFSIMLANNIKKYEDTFGEINLKAKSNISE